MCLDKLEDFEVTQKHGWQVFTKTSTDELLPCYHGDSPVPIGKWQRDKFRIFDRWIGIDVGVKYKKGYHIFLDKEDARAYCNSCDIYCIRKVRFKRIVARGGQEIVRTGYHSPWLAKVVVCRKRFIEPDETKDTGGKGEKRT